jgi:hypothetical protein
MNVRNRVGIGSARLHRLAESIPLLLISLKIPSRGEKNCCLRAPVVPGMPVEEVLVVGRGVEVHLLHNLIMGGGPKQKFKI